MIWFCYVLLLFFFFQAEDGIRDIGVTGVQTCALPIFTTYSSALYNFMPEFALRFYAAVRAQDRTAVYQMLNDFVIPYLDIRDRARGYAVSIVKAGLTAVGREIGRAHV